MRLLFFISFRFSKKVTKLAGKEIRTWSKEKSDESGVVLEGGWGVLSAGQGVPVVGPMAKQPGRSKESTTRGAPLSHSISSSVILPIVHG